VEEAEEAGMEEEGQTGYRYLRVFSYDSWIWTGVVGCVGSVSEIVVGSIGRIFS
jgi:hypothetical protein